MNIENISQSLKYFYQDLIKTQRQLNQLKQHINSTLNQIKSLDKIIKQTSQKNQQHKIIKQSNIINSTYSNNTKFQRNFINFSLICKKCYKVFKKAQQLYDHIQNQHKRCKDCKQLYFQSQQDHKLYLCGQTFIKCQSCLVQIQRKLLDRHVKRCSFRKCHKCDCKIYLKSYAYHINNCRSPSPNNLENMNYNPLNDQKNKSQKYLNKFSKSHDNYSYFNDFSKQSNNKSQEQNKQNKQNMVTKYKTSKKLNDKNMNFLSRCQQSALEQSLIS